MAPSATLRFRLSRRLRGNFPPEWTRFTQLWLAFNAIYGGEPDARERARVRAAIRNHVSESAARRILRTSDVAIERILAIPPGDMRLSQWDTSFRRASRQQAKLYRNGSKTAVNRLAAVGGILYQVRCNLLHGSKDPLDQRDQMLVRESIRVLDLLVATFHEGVA